MYGVTTVLEPHPITGLAWIWNCLVLVVNDHLEIHQFQDKRLLLVRRIKLPTIVTCMGRHEKTLFVYGTDNVVYSIEFADDKIVIDPIAKFASESQQLPVDSYRSIVATKDWILLHVFQGLLIVVWRKPRKRSRGREAPPQVETFGVGAIVIINLVLTSQDEIAVLYRDTNYVYSLRIYRVDSVKGLLMVKQYEEFINTPQVMVAPPQGGVVVFSSSHMFYFAGEGTMIELSDSDLLTTVNMNDNVITKRFPQSQFEGLQFSAASMIEKNKIVAGAEDGRTFIVNFDADRTSKIVSVRRIDIISLGVTTLAMNIHHITGEWFIATSQFGCSALFKIVPKKPFMKVVQRMNSSPPIMDLVARSDKQIYVLRGLFIDGDVTIFRPEAVKLIVNLEISDVAEISGFSNTTRLKVNDKWYRWQKDDYHELEPVTDKNILAYSDNTMITSKSIVVNSNTVMSSEKPWIHACIEDDFIAVASVEGVTIMCKLKVLATIDTNQVSGLASPRSGWLVVTDWNGKIQVVHEGKILASHVIDGVGITSMAALLVDENLEIVVVTTKNEYHQLHLQTKNVTPTLIEYNHGVGGSEQLSLIPNKTVIFSYSGDNLTAFVYDSTINGLVQTIVSHQFSRIDKLVAVAETLVVLSEGKAHFCSVTESTPSWKADQSHIQALPIKMVILKLKLVVLACQRKLKMGEYTINYQLHLYDLKTMTLTKKYTFPDGEEVPSMVRFDESIVCLMNKSATPLRVFSLGNHFEQPTNSQIKGLDVTELKFQTLQVTDNGTIVIGGSAIFEVQQADNGSFEYIEDSFYRLPTFCVDVSTRGGKHVSIDLRRGVFVKLEGQKLSQVPLQLPLLFPTAVCTIPGDEGFDVIAGDDLGNLTVACWDGVEFTQLLAANLGAQINCITNDGDNIITGTVDGGVYKLVRLTEKEWEHVKGLKTDRLPWRHEDGSSADIFGIVNIDEIKEDDTISREVRLKKFI